MIKQEGICKEDEKTGYKTKPMRIFQSMYSAKNDNEKKKEKKKSKKQRQAIWLSK